MKKITLKGLLFTAFISSFFTINAQEFIKKNNADSDFRRCGIDKHDEALLNNPAYAASFYQRQALFQQKLSEIHQQKLNGSYQRRSTLYIPVAVHFEVGTEADRACLEAYAQTQIDVINDDYAGTNADQAALWPAASSFYPGLTPGGIDVKFCIATKNHPAGADPEVLEGNPLVTIGANGSNFGAGFPERDATYAGYMNFIIKDIGADLLGYSPLGGSIVDGGAVVMNTNCYGTGAGCAGIAAPQGSYNLGRTVTHELGHFYNLGHTFMADGGTSCFGADGDSVDDTPKVAGSTYGNPANGSVAGCVAGEYSLTMNYMDYVNDRSMYMFTPDQATIVEAYFATVASDWASDKIDCNGSTFSISSDDLGNCGADIAETIVDFTVLNGFNEVTTFSVTGLPVGATASFSPTTLSATGSTTLTVSGLSAVTDGVYPISIVGSSVSVTKNINITLNDVISNCVVSATTPYSTSITGVSIGTINNISSSPDGSGAENSGYSDLTSVYSTDLTVDSTYPLTVKIDADGQYRTQTKVWIDWDQNCTFDPSEEYDLGSADVTATANFDIATVNSPIGITVPSSALSGNTIMRVATIYSQPDPPYFYPTACGVNDDGEVEDYAINVIAPLSVGENAFGENGFIVYPNPSNDGIINLTLSTSEDIKIELFDITGRKVFSQSNTNNSNEFNKRLDFSNLTSGVYLLNAKSGAKQAIKKIIIQ
jgi:hypothetical protein